MSEFKLSGVIDESFSFAKSIESNGPLILINCRNISRITSIGIREWALFFNDLRSQKKKLRFKELSPCIARILFIVSGLVHREEIESVCAEFFCPACKLSLVKIYTPQELIKISYSPPEMKCQKCAGNLEFDDNPEEYFYIFKD